MDKHYLLTAGKQAIAQPVRMLENPGIIRAFSSPLGWTVLQAFATPQCPMDVAKKLGVHEQKVYYYITKFRDAGLLTETGKEQRHGTVARFYRVRDAAFCLRVREGGKRVSVPHPGHMHGLEPFILNGKLNARIIVGSPDPHGPFRARASDACCAIDLALFLGSLTSGNSLPNYKLDVETREGDLKCNIIVIGGPAVNMVTSRMNDGNPVIFDMKNHVKLVSRLSGGEYIDEENGLISITANPFDPAHKALLLAGTRFQGTRSAVLGFVNGLEHVLKGNRFNRSQKVRVVKGSDVDGDGVIDSVEFLE